MDGGQVLLAGGPPADVGGPLRRLGTAFADLLGAVADAPADRLSLLLVYDEGAARRAAEVVHASAARDDVIVRVVSPPASRALLVAQALAYAAGEVPLGRLAVAVPALSAQVRVHAVLDSVAGLADPAPTLGQHLLSWWPGSHFLVSSTPEGSGIRAGRALADIAREGAAEGVGVVVHHDSAPGAAWGDALAEVFGAVDVARHPLAGDGGWRCRRWAEIGHWPGPLDEVISRVVRRQESTSCGWCERTVARGQDCPFCGCAASGRLSEEVAR